MKHYKIVFDLELEMPNDLDIKEAEDSLTSALMSAAGDLDISMQGRIISDKISAEDAENMWLNERKLD